jgi:hypothetical protein
LETGPKYPKEQQSLGFLILSQTVVTSAAQTLFISVSLGVQHNVWYFVDIQKILDLYVKRM